MTGIGITLYLTYLQNYNLAALTVALFAPLIGFHFAIDKMSKNNSDRGRSGFIKIRPSKYKFID